MSTDEAKQGTLQNVLEPESSYRVVRLEADGLRCLRAVDIEIDGAGKVVEVTGDNGAGKSSVLDAIYFALAGVGKLRPHRGYPTGTVVRRDADSAVVRLTVANATREVKISREFARDAETGRGSSSLRLEGTDGAPVSRAFVRSLFNAVALDPLSFASLSPDEQQEFLKEATGFDTKAFTEKIDSLRAAKKPHDDAIMHLQNAQIALGKELEALPLDGDLVGIDRGSEVARLEAAIAEARSALVTREDAATSSWRDESEKIKTAHKIKIEELKRIADEAAANLESARAEAEAEIAANNEKGKATIAEARASAQSAVGAAEAARAEFLERWADATEARTLRAQLTKNEKALMEHKAAIAEALREIEELKALEAAALEKLPVEGASFNRSCGLCVEKDGAPRPLREMSSAEKIKIGLLVGGETNHLKCIVIRDGSLLDDESLSFVRRFAERRGYTVFLETVRKVTENPIFLIRGRVQK